MQSNVPYSFWQQNIVTLNVGVYLTQGSQEPEQYSIDTVITVLPARGVKCSPWRHKLKFKAWPL